MKKLPLRIFLPAALVAAVLVGTASTSPLGGGPILTGDGIVNPPMSDPNGLEFTLVETGGGEIVGYGKQWNVVTGLEIEFEITSYEFVGDILCIAGPITATNDDRPQFALGNTAFFCLVDNGDGGSGEADLAGAGQGPPGLTIQTILDLIGPPPPEALAPLGSGNFTIH